jgi:hypothetical protein
MPENGNNQQQFSEMCLVSQTQSHPELRQIGELAQVGQRRQFVAVDLKTAAISSSSAHCVSFRKLSLTESSVKLASLLKSGSDVS